MRYNYTQSGIPLREGDIVRTALELLCNGNIFLLPINKAFITHTRGVFSPVSLHRPSCDINEYLSA